LQVILVIIVIFWPGSVTYWLDKPAHLDPSKIEIPMPQLPQPFDLPPPVIKKREQERGTTFGRHAVRAGGTQRANRGGATLLRRRKS
jgi:hypothetical protein